MTVGVTGMTEVNGHLMRVYAGPLEAYLRVSRWRRFGDPKDLVAGFFADRLTRPDYLKSWASSRKRLRHWLVNGLVFYLKELLREHQREKRSGELEQEPPGGEPAPEEVLDRAFAVALVREALELTRTNLVAGGFEAHFEVFRAHEWEEVPYATLGQRAGVTETRARVMARTAREAFRRALRGLLRRDGGPSAAIDPEIQDLLEVLHG